MTHCHPTKNKSEQPGGCPPTENQSSCHPQNTFDWLLWGSATLIVLGYAIHLFADSGIKIGWLQSISASVFDLINTMWWSMILAALFVGIIGRIPQQFVIATLGKGNSWRGLWRATLAGLLLDLCSHGILMVGMQLYKRGASLGQVMAFLIASPWNSLSLTLILIALIGLPLTLLFIVLSMLVALISGRIFDLFVSNGTLPSNGKQDDLPEDFQFWHEARTHLGTVNFSGQLVGEILWDGVKGSRMVLRWLLFGILLASALRTFVDLDTFQTLFGPTVAGLLLTLVAATIIEVCSEGSAPIAADIVNRAGAPGNGFAFLMTGVSTDYTEIMSIKDTTNSWKIALFLPLVTVPQIVVLGWLINTL